MAPESSNRGPKFHMPLKEWGNASKINLWSFELCKNAEKALPKRGKTCHRVRVTAC